MSLSTPSTGATSVRPEVGGTTEGLAGLAGASGDAVSGIRSAVALLVRTLILLSTDEYAADTAVFRGFLTPALTLDSDTDSDTTLIPL